jgi:hypothetical protein
VLSSRLASGYGKLKEVSMTPLIAYSQLSEVSSKIEAVREAIENNNNSQGSVRNAIASFRSVLSALFDQDGLEPSTAARIVLVGPKLEVLKSRIDQLEDLGSYVTIESTTWWVAGEQDQHQMYFGVTPAGDDMIDRLHAVWSECCNVLAEIMHGDDLLAA